MPRTQSFDLALDGDPPAVGDSRRDRTRGPAAGDVSGEPASAAEDAPVSARFVAVVIDLLILALIDVTVVYFTMQICGVRFAEFDILPKWPLCAFLFAQNVGYLVAFTAGGQTLGKMARGDQGRARSVAHRSISAARAIVRRQCGSCWPRRPVSVS